MWRWGKLESEIGRGEGKAQGRAPRRVASHRIASAGRATRVPRSEVRRRASGPATNGRRTSPIRHHALPPTPTSPPPPPELASNLSQNHRRRRRRHGRAREMDRHMNTYLTRGHPQPTPSPPFCCCCFPGGPPPPPAPSFPPPLCRLRCT
jgi:hypothetical protein